MQDFERIFGAGPVVAFRIRITADGVRHLEYVTENIRDIVGYAANDLLADKPSYFSILHPDDLARFQQEMATAITGGEPRIHQDFRISKDGGETAWISCVTLIRKEMDEVVLDGYAIDATDRKRQEFELSGLFENASVGVWVIDLDGTTLKANNLFARLVGRSRESLAGCSGFDLIDPESVPVMRGHMKTVDDTGAAEQFEVNLRTPEGAVVPCQITLSHCPGDECGEAGLFAFVLDVSRERSLERVSREREIQFRTLMESSPVGVVLFDETVRFANPAFADLVGFSAEDVLGMDIAKFTDESGADMLYGVLKRARSGEEFCDFGQRITVRTAASTTVTATIHSCAVMYEGARVVLANIVDVTELIRSQEELAKSERRFRDLFFESGAVMLLVDPATLTITNANRTAEKFYGRSRSTLVGLPLAGITELSEEMIRAEGDNAVHWGKRYFIVRQRAAEGVRDVEVFASVIGEEPDWTLLLIVRDITVRKKAEKDLEQKSRQLESVTKDLAQRVKDEFEKRMQQRQLLIQQNKLAAMGEMMGAIAHQWRQPLNSLALIIQDLEDAQEYGEIDRDYVADIVRQGMRQIDFMSKTIDDFREFFKPSREKMVFDIRNAVLDVMHLTSPQLRASNIIVETRCACRGEESATECDFDIRKCENDALLVMGYPNEFKQVILNIVQNAKDAIIGNLAADAERRIVVSVSRVEHNVEIRITDNGGGIPEEILSRVFDPYFTTKDEGSGTGIGLYMSKMIVENNMGGSLRAEVSGDTTSFIILLERVERTVTS